MSRPLSTLTSLRSALPSIPGPSNHRSFHFTSPTSDSASRRKAAGRERKKARIEERNAPKPQPDYILGHINPPITARGHKRRLLENSTVTPLVEAWEGCRLSKVLLHPQTIWNLPVPDYQAGGKPEHLIPGLSDADRELIFGALPHVTTALKYNADAPEQERDEGIREVVEEQGKQSEMLMRIMDLRNAGRNSINAVNRRRVIDEFGGGWDTGCSEVQAALMTLQIRGLNEHMLAHKKDLYSRRALRMLIHQRARTLKYFKRIKPKQYDSLLADIGVTKEAVEGELVTRL